MADPENYQMTLTLSEGAEPRRGSVVGSWLLDLTAFCITQRSRA